jgi:uncharacterized RDD family membrane protein YckC
MLSWNPSVIGPCFRSLPHAILCGAYRAMYALKRMAAYAIDLIVLFTPITLLIGLGEARFLSLAPEALHAPFAIGAWGLSVLIPAVIIGTISGLTGRTPGKLLMFLKIHDHSGSPPGIAQGILREIVKLFALGFFFGTLWALLGIIARGQTFYDEWMDLEVEDLNPVGLTPTQKNFRKYMRQQARLKGR